MIKKLRILKKYLQFRMKAGNAYSIHSPFVYSLYTEALRPKSFVPDKNLWTVEKMLSQLYDRKLPFLEKEITENIKTGKKLSIGKKVKSVSQNSKCGRILYRIVKKFHADYIIELGTGAGVSTLYMSCAAPSAMIFTVERNPAMVAVANELFQKWNNNNIQLIEGLFNSVLPSVLEKISHIDIAFIDGDHKGESLLRYYKMLLPLIRENSIFILHDIYWSDDMNVAWKQLIARPEVHISIDVFHFGLLFFNKGQSKQHFLLKV